MSRGDWSQALVRLWKLAGQRNAHGATNLVAWQQVYQQANAAVRIAQFRRDLETGVAITSATITTSPLEFVQALDRTLFDLTSGQPLSDEEPFVDDGETFWLIRISSTCRRTVPFARQSGNHEAWFRFHCVVPTLVSGLRVQLTEASGRVRRDLEALGVLGTVTLPFWIAHFHDGCQLREDPQEQPRLWFTGIDSDEDRWQSIVAALERAVRGGARAFIAPELTIDLGLRERLRAWLTREVHQLILVVAGSFHQKVNGRPYNRAELWNHQGDAELAHHKLRAFGEAGGVAEAIDDGETFSVLLTPIGAMAILICKDFMDAHQPVADLLTRVPVDWVWVPSLGNRQTRDGHLARARTLARVGPGTTSVVACQCDNASSQNIDLLGFIVQSGSGERRDTGLDGEVVAATIDLVNQAL